MQQASTRNHTLDALAKRTQGTISAQESAHKKVCAENTVLKAECEGARKQIAQLEVRAEGAAAELSTLRVRLATSERECAEANKTVAELNQRAAVSVASADELSQRLQHKVGECEQLRAQLEGAMSASRQTSVSAVASSDERVKGAVADALMAVPPTRTIQIQIELAVGPLSCSP